MFFIFYIQRKRRDLKPTVKKTVRWTVFREERWWYYNWEQAVIYEAESKRIRKSTSGGPKNKKHPLRCFLFLYTKKTKGFKPLLWGWRTFLKFFKKVWKKCWHLEPRMVLYMSSQREIQKQNKISCETAKNAGVAQLVEQLICNQQVGGSSPSTSSNQAGNWIWKVSRVAKGNRL